MKKELIFCLLLALSTILHAQNRSDTSTNAVKRNMAFEFGAGYSLPLGNFASSDKSNKMSGFATGGWQAQLTFDWMGKKSFGLALQYTYQRNPMEHAANMVYPNGIPDSLGSGAWSNHFLLIGPVFMKRFNRFQIDAKILGGALISAGKAFDTPSPADSTKLSYSSNIATGFGYAFSVGAGYNLSSHWTFKVQVSLMGGWPSASRNYGSQLIGYEEHKDPVTGIVYTTPVYSAPIDYDIKKVVTTLNPSLGLIYRF